MPTPKLGARIRDARIERGLSGTDLARMVGISPQVLSKIELDQTVPTAEVVRKLSRELGLPEADLVAQAGILPRPALLYLSKHPYLLQIIQTCSTRRLTDAELEEVLETVRSMGWQTRRPEKEKDDEAFGGIG